jgi:hypothetical protein
MATTLKVAGQVAPSAATLTTLYTVPAATQFVGQIVAANTSATPTAIRVSVQIAAAADNIKQYITYDTPIAANDVITIGGVALNATDVVKVYNTLATVSFSIMGQEIA